MFLLPLLFSESPAQINIIFIIAPLVIYGLACLYYSLTAGDSFIFSLLLIKKNQKNIHPTLVLIWHIFGIFWNNVVM